MKNEKIKAKKAAEKPDKEARIRKRVDARLAAAHNQRQANASRLTQEASAFQRAQRAAMSSFSSNTDISAIRGSR